MKRIALCTLTVAAWLASAVAAAQAPGGAASPHPVTAGKAAEQGPTWSALSPAQREALAPLRQDWPSIDAGRKQKWLEVVQRFASLSPAERERVQERMADWARMTPAERGRARLQFQESRQIPTRERQALWEAYQALPSEERRALAERAASAPTSRTPAVRQEARPGSPPVAKQNIVPSPTARPVARPVAPTIVQVKPGASTTLVSRSPAPPLHSQAGLPKIAATPEFVDPATLLPTRGPQAAAILTPVPTPTPAASPAGAPPAPAASEPDAAAPPPPTS